MDDKSGIAATIKLIFIDKNASGKFSPPEPKEIMKTLSELTVKKSGIKFSNRDNIETKAALASFVM